MVVVVRLYLLILLTLKVCKEKVYMLNIMNPAEEYSNTSHTLLEQALDLGDEVAWKRLYTNYMNYVCYLLSKIGVQQCDLDDVSQTVFVKLTNELPKYDRSRCKFRTWFYHLIKSSALMHFRKEKSLKAKNDHYEQYGEVKKVLEGNAFDALANKEWEAFLITKAIDRIKKNFRGKAVEVFQFGLKGLSAAEIAERLDMEVSSVYTIRKRLKKSLSMELEAIKADLEW